jgi:hypothetical protein
MAADARTEWVQRVLNVAVGAAGEPSEPQATGPVDDVAFKRRFAGAVKIWRDASESVDGQLNELRRVLLATEDKDLHRIAEFGLNGITGTRKVSLQKALLAMGAASGSALVTLGREAAQRADEYRAFITSDPRVQACDAYPKITVPIGATLGGALAELSRSLTV